MAYFLCKDGTRHQGKKGFDQSMWEWALLYSLNLLRLRPAYQDVYANMLAQRRFYMPPYMSTSTVPDGNHPAPCSCSAALGRPLDCSCAAAWFCRPVPLPRGAPLSLPLSAALRSLSLALCNSFCSRCATAC